MMTGVNFGMDGMVLDGTTWWNSKTGDSFKVVSNYFEDNRMVIQTNDGRMMSLDAMNDYVQWQGEGQPPKPQPQQPTQQELPPEVAGILDNSDEGSSNNDILPEDLELITGSNPLTQKGIGAAQPQKTTSRSPIPHHIQNYDIIERALGRAKKPDWNLTMKWAKFPQKELDMLITVMDIPMTEITDYYVDKIQGEFDEFIEGIKKQFGEYIKAKLNSEEQVKEKKTNVKTSKKS